MLNLLPLNMKSLYNINASRLTMAIMLICAGAVFTGCSKDKEADVVAPAGDGSKLMVSVVGVADLEALSASTKMASAALKSTVKADDVMPSKMLSMNGFDALMEVERNAIPASKLVITDKESNTAAAGLRAEAVTAGVKYRLFLYKADGTFVSSTLMSSGSAQPITVETSTTYNWYALSYNNNEDVPDLVDRTNPTLDLPAGKDVLYASGTVTVPDANAGTNTALGIVFKHSLARVGVEINTMGMFADMSKVGITVSGISVKTATLALKTGALSNLVDGTQTVDYSSFKNVDPAYADAKVAYIYTADAQTTSSMTVSVNALELKIDDGSTRVFSALATTPSVFTFNNFPRKVGATYTARMNMIESPLTRGNIKWARQNLYYVGGHNPYRFHHTYAHVSNRNSFFSFGATLPQTYGRNGDPCDLVYPGGVWRRPTSNELAVLTGNAGLNATYGVVDGKGYFEYTAAGTAAPYPGNSLRFNMNGEGVNIGLVENLINVDLGNTYGVQASYWSSSELASVPLLGVGLGANSLEGVRTTPILGSTFTNVNIAPNLLNIDLLDLGVAKTSFKNIRCVRATVPVNPGP
jgi:hypothetical protein